LEIAIQYAKNNVQLKNKIRFIFFAAEEKGLIGSMYYVNNLSQNELKQISLMLNYDMLGSPNYVRFLYNGSSVEPEIRNVFFL
jgi:Zn-dependent M28 family amino/carboxypeptidase